MNTTQNLHSELNGLVELINQKCSTNEAAGKCLGFLFRRGGELLSAISHGGKAATCPECGAPASIRETGCIDPLLGDTRKHEYKYAPPSGEGVDRVFAWMKPDCSDVVLAKHRVDRWINVYTIPLYTTPQSAPVDGDWRKSYSVEIKLDPPFPYGVAVVTDANGEQSVHVHDDNPVLWHLLNKLTTPPPASQERGGDGWQVVRDAIAIHQSFNTTADMADWLRDLLPPSSAVEDVTAGGTSTSDDELPGMWSPSDLTGGATDAAEQAKPEADK